MKIRISHHTRYEYNQSVEFAPHFLYLRPREDQMMRLHYFNLSVSPAAKIFWMRDDCDNVLACAHFQAPSSILEIRTEFEIENHETHPLDFVAKSYAAAYPFQYEPLHRFNLAAYLMKPGPETQTGLLQWLDEHFKNRPKESVPFLYALNEVIFKKLKYRRRDEHGIQPSMETACRGSGSCRDFAVFLMEILRTLGFAARFVSGYDFDPIVSQTPDTAMHSWVEVYLPGAGWKGMDPSTGLFCFDAYVPLAHAAVAESVNPIQGAYAPLTAYTVRLSADISIQRLPETAAEATPELTSPLH